jgi:hypothetical protein
LEGDRFEVVIKLRGSVIGGGAGLAREMVAAELAEALHLQAPRPFLVEISPEFAASMATAELRARFEQNIGWHFGSSFLSAGWNAVLFGDRLPYRLIDPATRVIAFDALIGNDDRHEAKSNCLVRGGNLMVIDHERAFPRLAAGSARPWEQGGLDFIRGHAFFRGLRGQLPDFEPVREAWVSLSETAFPSWVAAVPDEWNTGDAVESLEAYLVALRQNFRTVLDSLQILLQ